MCEAQASIHHSDDELEQFYLKLQDSAPESEQSSPFVISSKDLFEMLLEEQPSCRKSTADEKQEAFSGKETPQEHWYLSQSFDRSCGMEGQSVCTSQCRAFSCCGRCALL
jgi:hypothetical protein